MVAHFEYLLIGIQSLFVIFLSLVGDTQSFHSECLVKLLFSHLLEEGLIVLDRFIKFTQTEMNIPLVEKGESS